MRRLLALALSGILLGGCALESPPVTLHAGVSPTATSKTTIGVVPFEDVRPDNQRQGEAPNLIPLLVWNQRIGNYMTGTGSFTDEVSRAVTQAAADSISGKGIGTAIVLSEPGGDSKKPLTTYCDATGIRWVVSGSIHDLYATLHQKAYFFIIPTPWAGAAGWDNDLTDPLGVARFKIRILDCQTRSEVLNREFRAERHYAKSTLPEGARRAMEEALNQLADSIHLIALGKPAPAAQSGVRDGATTDEERAEVTDGKKALVEDKPATKESTHIDQDLIPVTIKYDARLMNKFDVVLAIDGRDSILVTPDSETQKHFSKGKHLLTIVDPKKGMFHKPDWGDYEFTMDIEDVPNQTILIESRGMFRISLVIKIYSDGKETARYKIGTTM